MTDDPYLTPDQAAAEQALADQLQVDRPLPRPSFRETLARRLSDDDPGWGPRPERLWPQALALVALGAVLLVVGAALSVGSL